MLYANCLSGYSVITGSLCLSLREELYIIYLPACVTTPFFLDAGCQNNECVSYYHTTFIYLLERFTLSDVHVHQLRIKYVFDIICMWSIKFDTIYSQWCAIYFQFGITSAKQYTIFILRNIIVPNGLWKPNSKKIFETSHLNPSFFVCAYGCGFHYCSFFPQCSPQSWLESVTKKPPRQG